MLEQLRRDGHALLAPEGFQIAAKSRSSSRHKGATHGLRDVRGNTAGSIESTTFPIGRAPGTEGPEIGDSGNRVAT
jgi:hypothetical protein